MCIHMMEYYSAIQREGNVIICNYGVDLEGIMISEINREWQLP